MGQRDAVVPSPKWVYVFAGGKADGRSHMYELLGGKGANLAEMACLGLPVPPGFTITTEVCDAYYAAGHKMPDGLKSEVDKALAAVGREVGATFGDEARPLLVSVRSGARASMPGMMDTILNLGLNDETVRGSPATRATTASPTTATGASSRCMPTSCSASITACSRTSSRTSKTSTDSASTPSFPATTGRRSSMSTRRRSSRSSAAPFPRTRASSSGARSRLCSAPGRTRAPTRIGACTTFPEDWGTAVTVQAMVFGNLGETSATGVAFTRNPSTGANEIYGEFLLNAQGEDVVAGIRTPQPLTEAARIEGGSESPSLEALMPDAFAELVSIFSALEARYRDMQDIEFTIQNGKVWMLQTRSGKRTAEAAVRIAVELANEGIISRDEAVLRVEPGGFVQLLHPTIDPSAPKELIATGLPASPGAASGEVVFDADEAEAMKRAGPARDPRARRDEPRGHPRHARLGRAS